MNLRGGIGSLNCRLCAASFQMPIHHLHEPIDVFSEWLDACEAAERTQRGEDNIGSYSTSEFNTNQRSSTSNSGRGGLHDDDDDEDDDILGQGSGFKTKSKAAAISKNTQEDSAVSSKKSNGKSRPSYATLGLDDSDDDDDEEDED